MSCRRFLTEQNCSTLNEYDRRSSVQRVGEITSNAPWWRVVGSNELLPHIVQLLHSRFSFLGEPSAHACPPLIPARLDRQAVVVRLARPCAAPEPTWAETQHSAVLQFQIFVHLRLRKKEGSQLIIRVRRQLRRLKQRLNLHSAD